MRPTLTRRDVGSGKFRMPGCHRRYGTTYASAHREPHHGGKRVVEVKVEAPSRGSTLSSPRPVRPSPAQQNSAPLAQSAERLHGKNPARNGVLTCGYADET